MVQFERRLTMQNGSDFLLSYISIKEKHFFYHFFVLFVSIHYSSELIIRATRERDGTLDA